MYVVYILHSFHEDLNALVITSAKFYLCFLTNVETLLRLNVIMPLLEIMHSLIKFAQMFNMFLDANYKLNIVDEDK
jgi:hypothetical protein